MNDATIKVAYEDNDLAVISKPAGVVVHPGAGNTQGTLLEWLAERWPGLADDVRGGLVHRLDKDTSGLLLIAKRPEIREQLSKQFADRTVKKTYVALVQGIPEPAKGRIDAPITRHHADRTRMTVRPDGRHAATTYRTIKTVDGNALLEVGLETGRTHQIRVHLAALGYPIVGDATYGELDPELPRQFLHASRLAFDHPVTGTRIEVKDDLAPELAKYLAKLEA